MRSISRLLPSAPVAVLLVLCLAGCPTRPKPPEASSTAKVEAAASPQRHEGRPFDVATPDSLLTILAFRGGTLAKVGHNHVIASHDVSGTFYVPEDVARSTFELHIPVGQLVIDEPDLRSQEGPDFPTDIPDSAKEGTRRNMLSEALLNGAQYPDIVLVSQHIDVAVASQPTTLATAAGPPTTPIAPSPGSMVRADVQIIVRGQTHTVSVPVTYSLVNGELAVSGELPLKQTDLGLSPFTAMLGALAVQDEMRVRFHFVARAAATKQN